MELWIRTQNREALIKTNIIKWENGCLRGATDEDGWYQDLGKYKKKRALEVLDEIQRKLTFPNYEITKNTYSQNDRLIESKTQKESSNYVYEMPKE